MLSPVCECMCALCCYRLLPAARSRITLEFDTTAYPPEQPASSKGEAQATATMTHSLLPLRRKIRGRRRLVRATISKPCIIKADRRYRQHRPMDIHPQNLDHPLLPCVTHRTMRCAHI
ncbi:hypothetical protein M3J09_010524 [Ascochyta lentis]